MKAFIVAMVVALIAGSALADPTPIIIDVADPRRSSLT
jgi:hypothetical protein